MKFKIIGMLLASVFLGVQPAWAQESPADPNKAARGRNVLEDIQSAYLAAIQQAEPSTAGVFLIDNRPRRPGEEKNPGRLDIDDPDFAPVGIGSGVVLSTIGTRAKGLVLTCYHVVKSQLDNRHLKIVVRLQGGRVFKTVRVWAADPRSDLAVLELVTTKKVENRALKMIKADEVRRGQFVLALGNNHGVAAADGQPSAHWGIVSNIRRRAALRKDQNDDLIHRWGRSLIQTDARMGTGASGSALINIRGEMIGMVTTVAGVTGLESPGGFAIPTDTLTLRTIEQLRQGKEVEYGFLGIAPEILSPERAQRLGVPGQAGIFVAHAYRFLPAYRDGGLRPGDVITTINDKPISNTDDLVFAVGRLPVGEKVKAKVYRNGKRTPLQLELPLAKYPVKGRIIATQAPSDWRGLKVDHLSTTLGRTFRPILDDQMPEHGVIIRSIKPGSLADQKKLKVGQIITHLDGKPIKSPDEFSRKVAGASGMVKLRIHDGPTEEIQLGAE